MIVIEYSKDGKSNGDLNSETLAMSMYDYYKGRDYHYHTSTESLVTAFRVLVVEGKIPHNEVAFKYNGKILKMLANGQLEEGYPNGFCDAEMDLRFRILKVHMT